MLERTIANRLVIVLVFEVDDGNAVESLALDVASWAGGLSSSLGGGDSSSSSSSVLVLDSSRAGGVSYGQASKGQGAQSFEQHDERL